MVINLFFFGAAMKPFGLVCFVLMAFQPAAATPNAPQEVTDVFTDSIRTTAEDEVGLVIKFSRHAAIYRVSKSNPNFQKMKADLKKYEIEKDVVKVVAAIPSMEIKHVAKTSRRKQK